MEAGLNLATLGQAPGEPQLQVTTLRARRVSTLVKRDARGCGLVRAACAPGAAALVPHFRVLR